MDHIRETRPGLEGRKGFPKRVDPELRWEAERDCAKALGGGKHESVCALCKNLLCKRAQGAGRESKGCKGGRDKRLRQVFTYPPLIYAI